MQDEMKRRMHAAMGGQKLPQGAHGHGVKVLYRCGECGHPHLQDGTRHVPRLATEELAALAGELGADLAALPYATCDLCAVLHGIGELGVDEYNSGAGYGLSYEAADPPGGHILVTVFDGERIMRQGGPRVTVVSDFARCRAVLAWLGRLSYPAWGCLPIAGADAAAMAADNRPGHGAPGTAGWVWRGATWAVRCPPLGGVTVQVVIAQAMPPGESYSLLVTIQMVHELTRYLLAGRIAGEVGDL